MTTTILIVDDEDNFREGFDQYLTNKGYNVHSAANLTDARKILRENEIDIVLLDVQIGKEYGPDFLDDINRTRPTPVTILLTAYGEVDVAVSNVEVANSKTKVSDCAKKMKSLNIEQIPVIGVEGDLVGLVRASDLIKALVKNE